MSMPAVPSAPIDVGAVIRTVFRIYVDEASVLMPASAVVFVITGIVTRLIAATGSSGLVLLALIIDLVASTLFTGMVVELVAGLQSGRRQFKAAQLLRAVMPVIGQLVLVAIVAGVLEGIGFALLIVPGLILLTIWSVVAPVVVVESPGGLRALRRSRALVRGSGWQVFGVLVVLLIGVLVVSLAIEGLAGSASATAGLIVSVIVGILAAPISALAEAVLYFELRDREREAGGVAVSGQGQAL